MPSVEKMVLVGLQSQLIYSQTECPKTYMYPQIVAVDHYIVDHIVGLAEPLVLMDVHQTIQGAVTGKSHLAEPSWVWDKHFAEAHMRIVNSENQWWILIDNMKCQRMVGIERHGLTPTVDMMDQAVDMMDWLVRPAGMLAAALSSQVRCWEADDALDRAHWKHRTLIAVLGPL